jgi:hypothetical protein
MRSFIAWVAPVVLASTHAAAQFSEVEPNDAKTTATLVTLAPGESASGVTTGLAGTGDTSVDFIRVTTTAAPGGLYRYRLGLTSTNSGSYNLTLRGSPQSNGAPATGDALVQLADTGTQSSSFLQWYGFGRSEFITARIAGEPQTVAPYTLTLSREPVTPVGIDAPIAAGPVTITTRGRTLADTEFWVYDANFFALTTFGNDDETTSGGGTGTTRQSIATRTLTEGVYYLAISDHNLANNFGSPSDDRFRIAAVLDSPGSIAQGDADAVADLDFAIASAAGTVEVIAAKPGPFGIAWYRFTVGPQNKPLALAAPVSVIEGQPITLRATVTPAPAPVSTQIAVTADAAALGAGTVVLRDDGLAPDTTANDNVFAATVVANTAALANPVALPLAVTDAQGRSSLGSLVVNVTPSPSGACCVADACQQLRQYPCTVAGGVFQGAGTTCAATVQTGGAAAFEVLDGGVSLTLATIASGNLDDGRWTVALPFAFVFEGDAFTQMSVCTNGFLQLGDAAGYSVEYENATIPTAAAPNAMIAPLWDDLELPTSGEVRVQTLGTQPNRRTIVSWQNVRRLASLSDSLDFQVALFEGSNRIEVRYGELSPGVVSFGATAGIESATGLAGISLDPAQIGAGNIAFAFAPSLAACVTACDDIDFNNNAVFPEDQDVIDFFNVLSGQTCEACNDIDFNNNGVFPEDQDVIDFFAVLSGGDCA